MWALRAPYLISDPYSKGVFSISENSWGSHRELMIYLGEKTGPENYCFNSEKRPLGRSDNLCHSFIEALSMSSSLSGFLLPYPQNIDKGIFWSILQGDWEDKSINKHGSALEKKQLLLISIFDKFFIKTTLIPRHLYISYCACSGFPGSSAGKESSCNVGDPSSIPGLDRSPGEGLGYPL